MVLLLLVWAGSLAISCAKEGLTSLAREEQNPLSTTTQLGLKYFTYIGAGIDGGQNPDLLNVHLSLPYKWSERWNLITQANMPFMSWQYGAQNYSGAGNLQMQMYFSPRKNNRDLIWGVGPALQFPTATNPILENGQFAAGPAFAIVKSYDRWVNALQGYHLWKIGGNHDRPAMSYSFVQLAVNYNLKSGWALGFGSGIAVNWTISQGEKSTVPIGLTIGRTIMPRRGKQPLSWNIGVSYNVIRPAGAPKLQYLFKLTYLFPQRTVDSPKPPANRR